MASVVRDRDVTAVFILIAASLSSQIVVLFRANRRCQRTLSRDPEKEGLSKMIVLSVIGILLGWFFFNVVLPGLIVDRVWKNDEKSEEERRK